MLHQTKTDSDFQMKGNITSWIQIIETSVLLKVTFYAKFCVHTSQHSLHININTHFKHTHTHWWTWHTCINLSCDSFSLNLFHQVYQQKKNERKKVDVMWIYIVSTYIFFYFVITLWRFPAKEEIHFKILTYKLLERVDRRHFIFFYLTNMTWKKLVQCIHAYLW